MKLDVNQIISYREMCNTEQQEQLQRGMNFGIGGVYSVLLMSVKPNSPYADRISDDGLTIYYEGHDSAGDKRKILDQPDTNPSGSLTQNGLFRQAADKAQSTGDFPLTKVYEKLQMGIWTYRGLFEIRGCNYIERNGRKVFEFVLTITEQVMSQAASHRYFGHINLEQTRQIPGKVKLAVFKRDKGVCTKCGSKDNLHFDHILPYSRGGTSLKQENIQLLCARHNLEKSATIDY
ncbi:MAG: HNH endonuclease [Candidatus Saccharimonadales bacterium]